MKFLRLILGLILLAQLCSAQAPASSSKESSSDYRVAPRDQLQFQVFGEPDTLLVQRVSSSGEISIPMIGDFRVAGLTLREAEKHIAALYIARGIFIDVQVILSVQTYAPRYVSVLGQVGKPGSVDIAVETETIGIVDAITQAGGFTRVSRSDSVRIIRKTSDGEQSIIVNVAAYLENKTKDPQFKLQSEDIVYVPERTF